MKFAHMSDCHLGGWRDPVLKDLSMQCFQEAIDHCIQKKVDFILISGDLFDTSRPAIETMEQAVDKLQQARKAGIRIYVIEGSHDFSPTGKTMLKVLEKTGLFHRTVKGEATSEGKLKLKFATDTPTGAKITGLVGRMGSLEREIYQKLERKNLEEEGGFKIFMFHTALDELKPEMYKHAEGIPLSLLPKGFHYYAGGHVHRRSKHNWEGYGPIVFPGPIFPTDFRELEDLESGGFYLVTVQDHEVEPEWQRLDLYQVLKIEIDAQERTPGSVEEEIHRRVEEAEVNDKIVLLRVEGTLSTGKPSDIHLREATSSLRRKGALVVKTKTSKLTAREYEEIKVSANSREELEDKLIQEHAGQHKLGGLAPQEQVELTKKVMAVLAEEQDTEETNRDYRRRMSENLISVLGIQEEWKEHE
ncbi:MAG: metallophosphoesterase family protein [Thermoproteota archaeon]